MVKVAVTEALVLGEHWLLGENWLLSPDETEWNWWQRGCCSEKNSLWLCWLLVDWFVSCYWGKFSKGPTFTLKDNSFCFHCALHFSQFHKHREHLVCFCWQVDVFMQTKSGCSDKSNRKVFDVTCLSAGFSKHPPSGQGINMFHLQPHVTDQSLGLCVPHLNQ